jgi:hypothetical protein
MYVFCLAVIYPLAIEKKIETFYLTEIRSKNDKDQLYITLQIFKLFSFIFFKEDLGLFHIKFSELSASQGI